MNDLLRRALADAQITEADIAKRLDVDPKTVQRWVAGRIPYPRHREGVAEVLGLEVADLWPHLAAPLPMPELPGAQVLAKYPHRWAVPRPAWQHLFQSARRGIGILVYAGLFLAEDSGITSSLAGKAREGVKVRILLGDPDGSHVLERGADEGVGDSLAAKIRNALVLYRPLLGVEGVELRLHDTVLYNSIYLADDDLLVNPHAYGIPASQAPVLHLRVAEDGDMASTYAASFERVWAGARALSRDT
ncbi:helix-turn-helix domain-containing protein [Spirillospora sp. CA-294931]|uniref:helix-turn-helix domain-containing protein n=1 Tax=Spirillospora sp. CA-294931 TaxID=3240042 RepID=UPI003D92F55A